MREASAIFPPPHSGLGLHSLAREMDQPEYRCETLVDELWLYPRDSRVGLNGSGLLIVNPPYLLADRMRVWLPELQEQLDRAAPGAGQAGGGTSIKSLAPGS